MEQRKEFKGGFIAKFGVIMRVMRRAKGPIETLRLLKQCGPIFFGLNMFETGLAASGRVPAHLKCLASVKTSALVGCPF